MPKAEKSFSCARLRSDSTKPKRRLIPSRIALGESFFAKRVSISAEIRHRQQYREQRVERALYARFSRDWISPILDRNRNHSAGGESRIRKVQSN